MYFTWWQPALGSHACPVYVMQACLLTGWSLKPLQCTATMMVHFLYAPWSGAAETLQVLFNIL
jgi:hypothetical protein